MYECLRLHFLPDRVLETTGATEDIRNTRGEDEYDPFPLETADAAEN